MDETQSAAASKDRDQPAQSSKDTTTAQRPPFIDIVPHAADGDAADADEEVAIITAARMSQNTDLGVPAISVQIASPMAASPPEEEGGLCSAMEKYAHAWTGNFDFEEDGDDTGADTEDGKKPDMSYQQGRQEDADNGEVSDEDDRPLSPTDYTLEDESDMNRADTPEVYHPTLLECRAPSPSEFSLLTESAEENELHRITHNAVPDDVFAIPDPSPSSTEMNMYLAMQYEQFSCSHHPDSTNDSVPMPGTNI